MPIDYSTLPIQPPAPLPEGATDAQRAAWLDQHRICASYAHGAAQQATAEIMAAVAASQTAMANAFAAPPAPWRPSREELVVEFCKLVPMRIRDTEASYVKDVALLVDKLIEQLWPTGV